ncbi:hypothetical protein F4818DRAFT_454542 [Hypoxylon cercidicola]|nr:hypothetical protein F4818DRAFT_454542 [Hypoxylon cercidicola]
MMTLRSTARIVGYQLVYGFGVGMGFGQPSYVVQRFLPVDDVPIGVTVIILVQNLSSSVFVAVGQTIFDSEIRSPAGDASDILSGDLGGILAALPGDRQEQALEATSTSIIKTFYVSLALSALSIVGVGVRWRSMKRDNTSEAKAHQMSEKQHDAPMEQIRPSRGEAKSQD